MTKNQKIWIAVGTAALVVLLLSKKKNETLMGSVDKDGILKTRKTQNGYIVNLVKTGDFYLVTTIHNKKRGYGTRYAGKSKEKALEHFNR